MTNKWKNLFVRNMDQEFCPSGTSLFFFVAGKEQRSRKENLLCAPGFANKDSIVNGRKGPGDIQNFSSARNYFLS